MRHPKRFCVSCNSLQWLTVCKHKTYSMYHCRQCGDEICRVGDGSQERSTPVIPSFEGEGLLGLACENPDLLSDEHRLWESKEPFEDRIFEHRRLVALMLLTPRQREIIEAVAQHNGQKKAAKALGITQQAVSRILYQIRKKLKADGCISDKKGYL